MVSFETYIDFVFSAASLAPSSIAAPPASPAHSVASASGQDPGAAIGDKETTTLIHNEEESFALAPVSLDMTNLPSFGGLDENL